MSGAHWISNKSSEIDHLAHTELVVVNKIDDEIESAICVSQYSQS